MSKLGYKQRVHQENEERILTKLKEMKEANITQISNATKLSRLTVRAHLIDHLEKRGLVKRNNKGNWVSYTRYIMFLADNEGIKNKEVYAYFEKGLKDYLGKEQMDVIDLVGAELGEWIKAVWEDTIESINPDRCSEEQFQRLIYNSFLYHAPIFILQTLNDKQYRSKLVNPMLSWEMRKALKKLFVDQRDRVENIKRDYDYFLNKLLFLLDKNIEALSKKDFKITKTDEQLVADLEKVKNWLFH